MTAPASPPAAVIAAGGVFLPAEVCHPLWLVVRAELDRRRRDGGQVRPEIADALTALRSAAIAHLSARGQVPGTFADIAAPSGRDLVTTTELATRLEVTERHARRIASSAGIAPAARNTWHRDDVAYLMNLRKDHAR